MKTKQKPRSPIPKPGAGPSEGPRNPEVDIPDTSDLMKRMRKVDPEQAQRYRQRSGQ